MTMETLLVLVHAEEDGSLGAPAREALAAGAETAGAMGGASLTVGVVGGAVDAAAGEAAGAGAGDVLTVSGPEFGMSRYATDVLAGEALVRESGATIVLAAATSRWARALPGVAHRSEGKVDTQVTGLRFADGALVAERWFYRRRLAAALTRSERPWFLLLAGGVFAPWQGEARPVEARSVEVPLPALRTRKVGEEAAAAGAATIRPDADLLLVAGAGWTKKQADGATHVKEAENLLRNFLEMTQASLGSSKSLVDQSAEGQDVISFLSHLNQVGQTGATPRHPKGLATCCHGEEPHVVGWRFIGERRAVNLDPNCGWAQGKADVLYVADAFQVMDKVNELLGKGSSG
jgi:electron transfer flavoprotein alpha subunit